MCARPRWQPPWDTLALHVALSTLAANVVGSTCRKEDSDVASW